MKKILKTNWERYKNSSEGKETITLFNHLTTPETTAEEMLEVIKRFNPEIARNSSKKEEKSMIESLTFYDKIVKENLPQGDEELGNFNGGEFYAWLTHCMAVEEEEMDLFDAPQIGFKRILGFNTFLSMVLFANLPDSFVPNLFVMQFEYFKKFAEKYEIELPEMPKRSDYRMRWFYYLRMCDAIDNFAIDNNLLDPGELCAFLFDYELTNIKEEMEAEHNKPMPKEPEQAWILVGNCSEGEKNMTEGVWQSNQLTCKGDIMLFYEKSPVKKLNAIWTALEDGFVDPFGPYYSYSIIGKKIEIPSEQAITYDDFKNSEYFKVENRGREGNFVSKKFQDVSGWSVTSNDYAEIKRMLEAKGFDISKMPSLYEPKFDACIVINDEKDVENKLLIPLLEKMGFKKGEDYKQQVNFPAGHGSTGKRPDFCLHLNGSGVHLTAKVVIEVKLFMKDNPQIKTDYGQALSYAKWGAPQIFVLCDKNQIRVYQRNKKDNDFGDYDDCKLFRWNQLDNSEKFNELKRLLSK